MNLDKLTKDELLDMAKALHVLSEQKKYAKLEFLYPDTGIFSRDKYPKHMLFFEAGSQYKERALIAANRVGKTFLATSEMAYHLTGMYPSWWKGKRFTKPIKAWSIGKTHETTRDILQKYLLGSRFDMGTGMIPKDLILKTSTKPGIPEAIQDVYVKHYTNGIEDGISELSFKSYVQGVEAFMGTSIHVVHLDEEPSNPHIYTECLLRTMTTKGIVICTFTPTEGLSETVQSFIPNGRFPDGGAGTVSENALSKYVMNLRWEDAPHLSTEDKEQMLAGMSPHERDARSKGIPQLGSGAIFPLAEEDITVEPFNVPDHWPRCYALDVGWKKTAAVWGAYDKKTDTWYLYSEYYRGYAEPSIHADAIRARGSWIRGVIDSAAGASSQRDGRSLLAEYEKYGLDLIGANKAVEAGLLECYQRLSSGRLKIFSHLGNTLGELRVYRRTLDGRIDPKQADHLMDCMRYLIMTGEDALELMPTEDNRPEQYTRNFTGRSGICGY